MSLVGAPLHFLAVAGLLAISPLRAETPVASDDRFAIAVIPETQFSTDYIHHTEAGFPFDARDLFFDQI